MKHVDTKMEGQAFLLRKVVVILGVKTYRTGEDYSCFDGISCFYLQATYRAVDDHSCFDGISCLYLQDHPTLMTELLRFSDTYVHTFSTKWPLGRVPPLFFVFTQ